MLNLTARKGPFSVPSEYERVPLALLCNPGADGPAVCTGRLGPPLPLGWRGVIPATRQLQLALLAGEGRGGGKDDDLAEAAGWKKQRLSVVWMKGRR